MAATVTRFTSGQQTVHFIILYHETETGFRIESETGLANRLQSVSTVIRSSTFDISTFVVGVA